MTATIYYGIDFSAHRRQEPANLVEFAATGGPVIDAPDRSRPVIILHDDQFIDPPSDCA